MISRWRWNGLYFNIYYKRKFSAQVQSEVCIQEYIFLGLFFWEFNARKGFSFPEVEMSYI